MTRARSVAHPNIALAKYWGKRDYGVNLPAVPSLSVTLGGMTTRTEVSLAPDAAGDALELDGQRVEGRPVERVTDLCDRLAGIKRPRVLVKSANDFPTASGLASSASAFAALAVAANAALGAGHDTAELSSIARCVSASAGRSLYGGFVVLRAGAAGEPRLPAEPLAPADHWDVALVVAVTTEDKKDVGSTEGMIRTARTSPLYPAWVEGAPAIFERVRTAVLARDFEALGAAAEHSALAMHATMIAADPGLVYWNGATVEVMRRVRALRREGLPAFFTIDAGPHVKVLTHTDRAEALAAELAAVPGVQRCIRAQPGEGARLVE